MESDKYFRSLHVVWALVVVYRGGSNKGGGGGGGGGSTRLGMD